MKKMSALILALTLALCPTMGASAESSHVENFFAGLAQARDGLIGMAEDAASGVSKWADESGVSGWVGNAVNGVTAWAQDIGLTAWAQGALKDISTMADKSGFTAWAQEVSASVQTMIDENGPAVEAWLKQAGEEVNRAWNTLVNADKHTEREVKDALETVANALNPSP